MKLGFSHSYAEAIPDGVVDTKPDRVTSPQLAYLNTPLAEHMGIPWQSVAEPELAAMFSGHTLPEDARPVAQAYAGHQFGHFNPQLGDGRAVILGELAVGESLVEVGLKGSGRTAFSRGGDGKAALGPMLREVLISEAMHGMGVPTTRALAVVLTGENVYRQSPEPGAVLTRIAASHIRVGTFQFFSSRQQLEQLKSLTQYALSRHYPEASTTDEQALTLLKQTARKQAQLIAQWMSVGFIHGVMNTDNMTISGETIDYGPCAFMEGYDEAAVFSSIDHQGRYAFGNQPGIGQWDLARLAEALLPLIDEDQQVAIEKATEALGEYADAYEQAWQQIMFTKLGLPVDTADHEDEAILTQWLKLLAADKADYTLSHRYLSDALRGEDALLRSLFKDQGGLTAWLTDWRNRLDKLPDDKASIAKAMDTTNPRIIPRNHLVEQALNAATETGSLVLFNELLAAIQQPFSDDPSLARFSEPADAVFTRGFQTFCGT